MSEKNLLNNLSSVFALWCLVPTRRVLFFELTFASCRSQEYTPMDYLRRAASAATKAWMYQKSPSWLRHCATAKPIDVIFSPIAQPDFCAFEVTDHTEGKVDSAAEDIAFLTCIGPM